MRAENGTTDKAAEIAAAESGNRELRGGAARVFFGGCIGWALFQIWYASPLPFLLRVGVFNDTEARSIHLAFAIFLAYLAFAARKKAAKSLPAYDWLLAVAGAACAGYIFAAYEGLAERAGAPILLDKAFAVAGLILLLEAARRALGLPLVIVAVAFIAYTLAGPQMPDVIAHKGASVQKLLAHQWLTTEGVFGVALGVSVSFVFLFVLFGALLEKSGAGAYFIRLAFSLVGHLRGGPAKAAVISSGLSGMTSGSSIANVVTTGTLSIPLMKRVGFPGHKAGAVEVAASTNGQLTPPVMGAAAFLMIEYVGVSYLEVIKHAILPALISYIALVYIVHLEAVKSGMRGLPKRSGGSFARGALLASFGILLFCAVGFAAFTAANLLRAVAPGAPLPLFFIFLLIGYVALVKLAAGQAPPPALSEITTELPPAGPTAKSGLYFLLPLALLFWCLGAERFSPGQSVFYTLMFQFIITLSHHPLLAFFRRRNNPETDYRREFKRGLCETVGGMSAGARNMIGIGIATAAAGIVVGTVTLTGIGQQMLALVELISGGSLLLMLIFTALVCIILGMGLPTTANYILVATLMAPVIVALAPHHGYIVPLIAAHLFVFYFGILADDTPPVGLAAFAAAGIAKSEPIKTGVQGFIYDMRTAILPFMFIFNTELLLIGVDGVGKLLVTVASAVGAMLLFAAATQGWWLIRSRWWESALLLLVAFSLFRPDFWLNRVAAPFAERPAAEIHTIIDRQPPDGRLRLLVEGLSLDDALIRKVVSLPLPAEGDGAEEKLAALGLLDMAIDGDEATVHLVAPGSAAEQAGIDFDWKILAVQVPNPRPAKEWFYLPALALLALVFFSQRRRRVRYAESPEL